MIEIVEEPTKLLGEALIQKISDSPCAVNTELFAFDDICMEFSYAYQVDWDRVTETPLIMVSPFLENGNPDFDDDCNAGWSYQVAIRIHAKLTKDISAKLQRHGDHTSIQTYMAFAYWLVWLFNSDDFNQVSCFERDSVSRGSIFDQSKAVAGKFASEIYFGGTLCLDRGGPCL